MSEKRHEAVDIQWVGPSTNRIYAGVHWSERHKVKQVGRLATRSAAHHWIKPFNSPVILRFTPFINISDKMYDTSNYSYSNKIIEDELVYTGIIQRDTASFVRSWIMMAPERTSLQSYTRLEIIEA